jgi:hypothetical protein
MAKTSEKGRTSGKSKAPAKTEETVLEGKNVTFLGTPETQALVEKAKTEFSINRVAFINRCIEEYGPILLQQTGGDSGEATPLQRISYLEAVTIELAYTQLLEKLEEEEVVAEHQELLESVNPQTWLHTKKLMAAAKTSPATEATKKEEWQTLMRKKEDFLEHEIDE